MDKSVNNPNLPADRNNEKTAATGEDVKEKLPSFFVSLRSTKSTPLKNCHDLQYYIVSDTHNRIQTEKYRETASVSRKLADNLKRNSHAICPSIQFNPTGRTLESFAHETLWLMLDYDHVLGIQFDELKQKVCKAPYTMVFYRTISGLGFRILLRYMRPPGCTLTVTELHQLAISKAMKYYNDLTNLLADTQCKDITRLCGLAHDPQAYFNWDAPRLPISPEEVDHYYRTVVKPAIESDQERSEKKVRTPSHPAKPAAAKGGGTASERMGKLPSFDDIITRVQQHARGWRCQFVDGSRHEYALRFALFCHSYGADEEALATWMQAEMGSQHEGVGDIVKWVYSHPESFGCWHLYTKGTGYGKNPGIQEIKQWLATRSELRFNTMTHKNEIRSYDTRSQYFYNWTQIGDREENTIYSIMDMDGLHVSQKKLHTFINSQFSQDFNPLQDYLSTLPAWEEGKDKDYIGELCERVTVRDVPDCYHTHDLFVYTFRKWFVAMVVGWMLKKVVNETVLLLVGKGGIFKTTFLEYLLPPQLHDYFTNDSTADYKNKDFLEYFGSKALICLDEFDAPYGKNLNSFKSCVTKKELNVRYPYDRYASLLIHTASLCGTSNNIHIINELENRRYLVWLVDSIDSPRNNPVNYEGIYSQALALGRKVVKFDKAKIPEGEWVYWLTGEDQRKQEIHNCMFMVNNYLEERIRKFYRVPRKGTSDEQAANLTFATASDILDKVCTNPVFRQSFSSKDIAAVMDRIGFVKRHRKVGNGWWVIEIDGETIHREAQFIHNCDEL